MSTTRTVDRTTEAPAEIVSGCDGEVGCSAADCAAKAHDNPVADTMPARRLRHSDRIMTWDYGVQDWRERTVREVTDHPMGDFVTIRFMDGSAIMESAVAEFKVIGRGVQGDPMTTTDDGRPDDPLFLLPVECYCGGQIKVQKIHTRRGSLWPIFDCASHAACCGGITEDQFRIDAARLRVPTELVKSLQPRDVLPASEKAEEWVSEWRRSAWQWRQDMDRAEEARWRTTSPGRAR